MASEQAPDIDSSRMSRVYPCGAPYRADVMERYRQMWRKSLFTDVIVRTTAKDFWAHSSYLAAWSDFLAGLLLTRKGDNPAILDFLNLDTYGVGTILDFMYNGHISLSLVSFKPILQTAVCLDIIPAVKSCLTYVKDVGYHKDIVKEVVYIVDDYPRSKADTLLKTFIKHNINVILKRTAINSLKMEFLRELLQFSEVNRDELGIFKAVLVWFHLNKPDLETKRSLLQLVRYDLMSTTDIKVIIDSPPELVIGCETVILRAIGQHFTRRQPKEVENVKTTRDFAQLVTSMHIDGDRHLSANPIGGSKRLGTDKGQQWPG